MSDQLPLCSSDQILAALKRAGFTVLGKRQVTRGTLRSILDQAGLSADEFRQHLR